MNKRTPVYLTVSAMFLSLGLVLPFLTGQIPQIGRMLLPMHLTVLLCGMVCGWQYGLVVGAITPILRSVLFGMPQLYPDAVVMFFELATYGFVIGIVYHGLKKQNIFTAYLSLIIAMISGRAVYGVVKYLLLTAKASGYAWSLFVADAFLNSIPGIVIQLVLIPALMLVLDRTGLLPYRNDTRA